MISHLWVLDKANPCSRSLFICAIQNMAQNLSIPMNFGEISHSLGKIQPKEFISFNFRNLSKLRSRNLDPSRLGGKTVSISRWVQLHRSQLTQAKSSSLRYDKRLRTLLCCESEL